MKRLFAAILIITILFSLAACAQKAEATWQEQYDLGVRYLNEGKYEEAVIAFNAAIEIDPKQADAYIGLAEVYTVQGDTEKAAEVLEKAVAEIGENEKLTMAMEALTDKGSSAVSNESAEPNIEVAPTDVPVPEETPALPTATPYNERVDEDNGSYYINEYDAYGNLVRKTYYYLEDVVSWYVVYEYDAKNNMTSVTSCGADATVYSRETFEYDSNNNVTKHVFYDEDNSVNTRETFEYDSEGRLKLSTEYDAKDHGYCVEEYDNEGNRIRRTYTYSDDSGDVSEYDASGKVMRFTYYSAGGNISHYELYEYNADDKVSKISYYDADDNLTSYAVYEYYSDGSLDCNVYNSDGSLKRSSHYNS